MTRYNHVTIFSACIFFLLLAGMFSCATKEDLPDRFDKGTIHVSCDESFKPVIDAEVEVYEASYPDTKIIVDYKPEAACLRDFLNDSVRMVIATRGYTEKEKKLIIDSLKVSPVKMTIARDLIALVISKTSKDTLFTMQKVKDMLTGKLKENLIPVFDGLRATSTVRFMLDSVLRGGSFGKNVVAAKSTSGVIDYVAHTKDAVGFVGYSWIGNEDDPAQLAERNKINVAYLESTDSANAYVRPAQYFIYTKSYPLIRDLVYTLKENYNGLGKGFADFLSGERGQLIFRRAYLMPAVNPYYVRRAIQVNQ